MTQNYIAAEEARSLAEKEKRRSLDIHISNGPPVLESEFFDLEHCYVFYRKTEIEVPEGNLSGDDAVAVSKTGGLRSICDLRSRSEETPDYPGLPNSVEEMHALIDKLAGEQDWN